MIDVIEVEDRSWKPIRCCQLPLDARDSVLQYFASRVGFEGC